MEKFRFTGIFARKENLCFVYTISSTQLHIDDEVTNFAAEE